MSLSSTIAPLIWTSRYCNLAISTIIGGKYHIRQDDVGKVREDILNSIPLANGMIQAGERIVDRGEIIDNHTYNVLRSLKIVHETKSGGAQRQGIIMGGQFVLVFGILFCFWLYLWSSG